MVHCSHPWIRTVAQGLSVILVSFTYGSALPEFAEAAQRKTLFYHPDHLGSPTLVTDGQGSVVQETAYLPYGATYRQTGTANSPHQFTGQRLDTSTGLYFYNARYYDPALGRFVSPDWHVSSTALPQDMNRYTYARNNPQLYNDPTGHFSFKTFFRKLGGFFGWLLTPEHQPLDLVRQHIDPTISVQSLEGGAIAAAPLLLTGNVLAAGVTFVSAVASSETLDTGTGRRIIRHIGEEIFDDIFGFSPRAAQRAAALTVYMAVNVGYQLGLGQALSTQAITARKNYDPVTDTDTAKKIIQHGGGINYGARAILGKDGEPSGVYQLLYTNDKAVGVTTRAFFGEHIGIRLGNLSRTTDLASFIGHPIRALAEGYGIVGISHTAVNVSLLEGGYSTLIQGIGGGWSTFPSTFAYGPYGGGLTGAVTFTNTTRSDQ